VAAKAVMFYGSKRHRVHARAALLAGVLAAGCGLPRPEPPLPPTTDGKSLCRRIEAVLAAARDRRRLDAAVQGAWQAVHGILAFGPDLLITADGQAVSALDHLLGGGPIAGWVLRPGSPGVVAVVEEGSTTGQGHPDQWIGYLSQCGVSTDAPDSAGGGPAAGEPFIASIVRQSLEARDRPAEALLADLPLQLETLVGMLDAQWHVTLFGSPHYLLNRGRGVLAGPLAKLVTPLRHLFGESIRGAALSAHVADQTYLELDVVAERDPPARAFAPQLAEHVEELPTTIEDYCVQLTPSPYGRVLVMRLPGMLRYLVTNMRVGVEGNGVVLNAYLPPAAAHNLALAAELALAQSPGAALAVAGPTPPAGSSPADSPAPPAGALGKLQKRITIVFPRDTLEMAIQMVSEEVGVPMEILGTDLQLDGITQNQSFGLEARDQTAAEVLRTILTQANPDGKLVYIVRTEDGVEKILVTTRAQVEKRGDPLPPEFEAGKR